jgi:hypothetical protein
MWCRPAGTQAGRQPGSQRGCSCSRLWRHGREMARPCFCLRPSGLWTMVKLRPARSRRLQWHARSGLPPMARDATAYARPASMTSTWHSCAHYTAYHTARAHLPIFRRSNLKRRRYRPAGPLMPSRALVVAGSLPRMLDGCMRARCGCDILGHSPRRIVAAPATVGGGGGGGAGVVVLEGRCEVCTGRPGRISSRLLESACSGGRSGAELGRG